MPEVVDLKPVEPLEAVLVQCETIVSGVLKHLTMRPIRAVIKIMNMFDKSVWVKKTRKCNCVMPASLQYSEHHFELQTFEWQSSLKERHTALKHILIKTYIPSWQFVTY